MTRSERLAKEGKVEVFLWGGLEILKVTTLSTIISKRMRYICTDFEAMYDGHDQSVDIYEDSDGELYGVLV